MTDAPQQFNVVLTGNLYENTTLDDAVNALATAAKIHSSKALTLFHRSPIVIKRDLTQEQAKRYQQFTKKIGIEVTLEPIITTAHKKELGVRLELVEKDEPEQDPTDGFQSLNAGLSTSQVIEKTLPSDQSNRAIDASESQTHKRKPFNFGGDGFEYFKIWIVNLLLTIASLGFYATWAKVRNINYFYRNTELDGARLSFHADPKQMLYNRLIAIGLLGLYFLIDVFVPPLSALLSIAYVFLTPWVVNSTQRFYAKNTRYRNIAFRFDGSYWEAFKAFILWPLAGLLSLGILYPVILQRQKAYLVSQRHFGEQAFEYNATVEDYYRFSFITSGIFIMSSLLALMVFNASEYLSLFIFVVGLLSCNIYHSYQQMNVFYNKIRIANHSFYANYEFKNYGKIKVINFIGMVLTLGLYTPFAKVNLAKYTAEHVALDVMGNLDEFVNTRQKKHSAFGEEFGDIFSFNVGM